MNKVVCYVCGTSYPENASQCPICGYVQSIDKAAGNATENTYTYVKGGRFSKANVKKRNQGNTTSPKAATHVTKPENKKKQKSNVGAIILITVLLLAILAVVGYIVLRFFLPNDFIYEGFDKLKLPGSESLIQKVETEPTAAPETEATTEPPLDCTALSLDFNSITLEGIGNSATLTATPQPVDTPDQIIYTSSKDSVAIVNEQGVITATGEGTTVITVTCGSISAECTVTCVVPAETINLTLNRKEITFTTAGENWQLYEGEVPADQIVWTSDDNKIATIESGKVIAVGEGDTKVYGFYEEQTLACVIHCKFEEKTDENGSISEADGNSGKTYTLFNPYGHADDATLKVGESFTLKLVDENLNQPDAVQWTVSDENVCTMSNNVVKGVGIGTAKVTATFDGKTYTCIVRINA